MINVTLKTYTQRVGTIARGSLYDRAISIHYLVEAGPFTSVKGFHDWFTSLYLRPMPDSRDVLKPFRQYIPDNSDIVFTHGDLHQSNIMLSSSQPFRVIPIVDWEQADWFPTGKIARPITRPAILGSGLGNTCLSF